MKKEIKLNWEEETGGRVGWQLVAEHRGLTIRIQPDECVYNDGPRDWDNAGRMICFHRNYTLGDKHDYRDPDHFLNDLVLESGIMDGYIEDVDEKYPSISAKMDAIEKAGTIILPLYLYDHSGLTMSTGPFSCPWDSGQVGWIYITAAGIRKNWCLEKKRITKKIREKARECLIQEVKTYDDYLTGNVHGYIIEDKEGNHLDSCWGFYGDLDYLKQEATAAADCEADRIQENLNLTAPICFG